VLDGDFRSDQGDALEMSFSLLGYPLAKDIQSSQIINGGSPKIKLGDSFTMKNAFISLELMNHS
jgi:hypothetical protein